MANDDEDLGSNTGSSIKSLRIIITAIEGFEEESASEARSFGLKIDSVYKGKGFFTAYADSGSIAKFLYYNTTASNIAAVLFETGIPDSDKNSEARIQISWKNDKLIATIKEKELSFAAVKIMGLREDEQSAGEILHDDYGLKVNLKSPGVRIGTIRAGDGNSVNTGNNIIAGLLLNTRDLSRREYRLYSTPSSVNAGVYSSALKMAGANNNEAFIDLMCADGTFCIEYYYHASKKSPLEFDRNAIDKNAFLLSFGTDIEKTLEDYDGNENKKPGVKASGEDSYEIYCNDSNANHLMRARQNSRLAGCEKNIRFSKMGLEWAGLKTPENSMTLIASKIPYLSKIFPEKKYEKLLSEFAEACSSMISVQGRIILISNEENIAINIMGGKGFIVKKKKEIRRGALSLHILLFSPEKKPGNKNMRRKRAGAKEGAVDGL